jgi:hypothetical protein
MAEQGNELAAEGGFATAKKGFATAKKPDISKNVGFLVND